MLTQILQELIDTALTDKQAREKPLRGKLYIHIRPREDGLLLTLYRFEVEPSAKEWNTVIAFWPWELKPLSWTDSGITSSNKHYKQAFIPF